VSHLADISGLEINFRKSRAIAMRGRTFGEEERARLASLQLPFVDASMPAADRGFVTVGVPTGSSEFISKELEKQLADVVLGAWRGSWSAWGRVTCTKLCRFLEARFCAGLAM
jgi:hypothetical protein